MTFHVDELVVVVHVMMVPLITSLVKMSVRCDIIELKFFSFLTILEICLFLDLFLFKLVGLGLGDKVMLDSHAFLSRGNKTISKIVPHFPSFYGLFFNIWFFFLLKGGKQKTPKFCSLVSFDLSLS